MLNSLLFCDKLDKVKRLDILSQTQSNSDKNGSIYILIRINAYEVPQIFVQLLLRINRSTFLWIQEHVAREDVQWRGDQDTETIIAEAEENLDQEEYYSCR